MLDLCRPQSQCQKDKKSARGAIHADEGTSSDATPFRYIPVKLIWLTARPSVSTIPIISASRHVAIEDVTVPKVPGNSLKLRHSTDDLKRNQIFSITQRTS